MSIRLRLTLLYTTILALTLVAFSSILYWAQYQYTINNIQDGLKANAVRIGHGLSMLYQGQSPEPISPRPNDWRGEPFPPELREQDLREWKIRDTVRLLNVDGTLFDHPINQDQQALPISLKGLAALQRGEEWTEIGVVEEERWLIYNHPVFFEQKMIGIVQLARPLTDRDRSLRALGVTLIAGSLLTTVAAFGIGWVLSGATLRPIHRLAQTARHIGATQDFARRVKYDGPKDEVGQLATTFNDMLAQLEDAYRRVSHALHMQRNFVADVSHELRTPLTTLRGNLALLGREPSIPPEERTDVLSDMVSETERLIRLVSDLLTLARADAKKELLHEQVAVKLLLEDICHQAQQLDPDREVICSPGDDQFVTGNRDALKQILLILVDNAIKHTTGPITIAAARQTNDARQATAALDDHAQIAISVRDTGPGIPPEQLDQVFDRFCRGDNRQENVGFGLGLSIAKALIEAQDGTIRVESEVERGSVFTITLKQAAG